MESDEDLLNPAEPREYEDRDLQPRASTPHLWYKITKTVFMVSIWVFVGLSVSLITPSVDDLRRQVNCNYEELTYALATRGVGTIAGAVSCGILNERFTGYTDIFISLELLLGGCAVASIPWIKQLALLCFAVFVVGFACGGLSASGNSHVVFIWGEKAAGPVHLVHFGYGLGIVIGPLLAGPFISKPIDKHLSDFSETFFAFNNIVNDFNGLSSTSQNLTDSRIYIPFGLCGGFSTIFCIVFMMLFCLPLNKVLYNGTSQSQPQNRPHSQQSFRGKLDPGSCAGGNTVYGIQMFSLLLLLYILIVSKDTLVATYTYAIAVDTSLAFSPWDGVLLSTMYCASYAVSRLVFAVIGHFVRIQITIFIEMALALAAGSALAAVGLNSHVSFWITICAFGFTAGPVYPSGMAFIDRYLHMTPTAFSILDIGIGIGALFSTWLTGYIFQNHSPQLLFFVSLGCAVGITILLIVMQILGRAHGDRYERVREEISRNNVINVNFSNAEDDEPLIA